MTLLYMCAHWRRGGEGGGGREGRGGEGRGGTQSDMLHEIQHVMFIER